MAEQRKKILFITTQLPFPPVSGGVIKSWKLCEMLSQYYDLGIACLLKNNDAAYMAELQSRLQLRDLVCYPLQVPRNAINLIKANLLGIPLNLYRNRSKAFRKMLDHKIPDYDVLFIDHYEMFQYVPAGYKGRVVLHQHNCEYLIWERFGELETAALKRFALFNQAGHIRRQELKICRQADAILAAPNDKQELIKIGAPEGKFFDTFHLGDTTWLQFPELRFEKEELSLFFVGTLTWEANIDGLIWLLNNVWPSLKRKYKDLKFYIVGKNPDERLAEAVSLQKGVLLEGFQENLEPYFLASKIFVAPLRFGSGIKVKVINAMYRGIPIITTPIGAEGIQVKHGEHILLAETSQEWVDGISALLENREIWEKIRTESRALAAAQYTWESVLQNTRRAIDA